MGEFKMMSLPNNAVSSKFNAVSDDFNRIVTNGEREIFELEKQLKERKQSLKDEYTQYVENLIADLSEEDKRAFIVLMYCHFGLRVGANNLAGLINDAGTNLGQTWVEAIYLCDECESEVVLSTKAADVKTGESRRVFCDECEQRHVDEYNKKSFAKEMYIDELRRMPYRHYLQTEHWQTVRRRALRRSDYKCQLCNSGDTVLDVHHRTYENRGDEHYKDVIVLCRPCHAKFHGKEV